MDYSRPFDRDALTGDTFRRLADMPSGEVCKTGFERNDILNWFGRPLNATLHYVAIITTRRAADNKRIFAMKAFNSVGAPLQSDILEGDLPCPDNCIPPEGIYEEEAIDNTILKDHIINVLNFGATYLNVHSSLRFSNNNPLSTHSIYGLTGMLPNLVVHTGPNDPVYTSIHGNLKISQTKP